MNEINKMKYIRGLTNLTQVEFSKKYNIPIRTIQDWESGKRKWSDYVLELLEFKVRFEKEILKELNELENNSNYNNLSDYDKGCIDGEYDRCVCLLEQLGIKHNFEFRGKGYE